MWKIFATYRFCSQRMIVMLRAENTCPNVFHFVCGESKRVKRVLKNEQIKSCWENVKVVSSPFDFFKWRFNSRHIYFSQQKRGNVSIIQTSFLPIMTSAWCAFFFEFCVSNFIYVIAFAMFFTSIWLWFQHGKKLGMMQRTLQSLSCP